MPSRHVILHTAKLLKAYSLVLKVFVGLAVDDADAACLTVLLRRSSVPSSTFPKRPTWSGRTRRTVCLCSECSPVGTACSLQPAMGCTGWDMPHRWAPRCLHWSQRWTRRTLGKPWPTCLVGCSPRLSRSLGCADVACVCVSAHACSRLLVYVVSFVLL